MRAAELEGVDAAAAFYHDWLAKRPPRPESGRFLAWVIFRFLGQPEEATKWARDYTDRAGPPIVPRPRSLMWDRYLRGEASGDMLLAEATAEGSRGLYEHFFIGLDKRDAPIDEEHLGHDPAAQKLATDVRLNDERYVF